MTNERGQGAMPLSKRLTATPGFLSAVDGDPACLAVFRRVTHYRGSCRNRRSSSSSSPSHATATTWHTPDAHCRRHIALQRGVARSYLYIVRKRDHIRAAFPVAQILWHFNSPSSSPSPSSSSSSWLCVRRRHAALLRDTRAHACAYITLLFRKWTR